MSVGVPPADEGISHVPVLLHEALDLLAVRPGGIYIDGTFGAGGYTRALLDRGAGQVLAIDRDPVALTQGEVLARDSAGRLTLARRRFSTLDTLAIELDHDAVDGVVLDLGVSSMQLDSGGRGFSFRFDGPLDMRMGQDGPTAADIVAHATERDLAAVIATLGEERHARAIARAIVAARTTTTVNTTRALVDIIARVVHPRPGLIHPATRTFQALRIAVNQELDELAAALGAAERILRPGGRLAIVSFHSLEDRIVKTFLTRRSRGPTVSRHQPKISAPPPTFVVLTRRPVAADDEEIARNPRARSARLRAAERTSASARADDAGPALPRLPSLSDLTGRR